jgi:hypothetical protein
MYIHAVMVLPPDLERLGQQLAGAAGNALAARRRRSERRRRVALAGVIGALAFAVLTPGPLGTGARDITDVGLAGADFGPLGCDHPRGASFRLPACDARMVLYRPYAVR